MASETSVFQTSGGGYDYEHYIQSSFLTLMIVQGIIPVFPNGKITEICFQCKNKGYTTDDLFIELNDSLGLHRVLIQIKYNIALTEKNETFKEVIKSFWTDFNKADVFDKTKDKFFLIKSGLTNDDKNHINVILDWASTHKDEDDFYSEVERIEIKNQKLAIFSNLLKIANGDVALSKKEIWEFLKCFKLLSYDFTSENSTDQAHILNLIKLSKAKTTTATPLEIWNSIVSICSQYNRNGGSIDVNGLRELEIFTYFDLSFTQEAFTSLQKIVDDGTFIIKPILNTINGFHINRDAIRQEIVSSINQNKLTFVTGTPGVGKSAIIKELLAIELLDSLPFIFKADQFNKQTLSQVFTEIGISHNLLELVSTITLLQNKIIIIDSGEKLLEGDPDNAFKQLLEVVKENSDLKVLITSRSYAVNVIAQKYGISSLNLIEIPSLSDEEIKQISTRFPKINNLLANKAIKEILRSPKYLEFALNAIDKSEFQSDEITLTEFKEKLWFQVIENGNVVRNGIARKREKTFNHIAVGRAVNMQLFFQPDDNEIDYEAIEALSNDNIITKNGNKYEFAPAHDILEDWALVRHISSINNSLSLVENLFDKLTSQPAVRRAFRLWIEELILTEINTVLALVRSTLAADTIERYWVDEILTAIFRSADCTPFFVGFKKELIANNATLLNRCILICRTTCKEYSYKNNSNKDVLLPIGSGWEALLSFINSNYSALDSIHNSIFEFLLDWEYKYIFNSNSCTVTEILAAKNIAITFAKEIENQSELWSDSSHSGSKQDLIYLILSFAQFDEDQEIKMLLERTLKHKKKESTWKVDGFYSKIATTVLCGTRNQKAIYTYPDIIIELANKKWKSSPEKPRKIDDRLPFSFPEHKDREDSWGVKKFPFDFFPPGLYKTFVYALLTYHPAKGLKFVVDFTNYMTQSYADSEYAKKDNLISINITLNSGDVITVYANDFLWQAYRGTIVTHYLLESILVAFEKYMLDVAKTNDKNTSTLLQSWMDYCLKNSNSVAISSVLTSVFLAYPKAVGRSILPILKCKECYGFDLHRATRENSALAMVDDKISFAQKERIQSNQLPHRKKFRRGLRDFIFEYQFNVGELNPEIFEILDSFHKTCKDDLLWEKAIYEMDSRHYKVTAVEDKKGLLQIEVQYPDNVLSAVTNFTEERAYEDESLTLSANIQKVIDEKEAMTIEEWKSAHSHFTSDENKKSMFDMPVSLAFIGLTTFPGVLDNDEKQWCLDKIADTLLQIVKHKLNRMSFTSPPYNIMEESTTFKSSHLLLNHIEDIEKLNDCKITIAYLLISDLANHEQEEYFKYFRTIFYEADPQFSMRLSSFLISYAKFYKENRQLRYRSEDEEKIYHETRYQFVVDNVLNENVVDEEITLETHEAHYLATAMLIMNVKTEVIAQQDYIIKLTEHLLEDQKLEVDYSHQRSAKNRKLDTSIAIRVRFVLNEILLYNEIEFCKKLLNVLIKPFLAPNYVTERDTVDMYKFTQEILSTLIIRYDDVVIENDEDNIQKYGKHFWEIWKELYEKLKATNQNYFGAELLLDTSWPINSSDWKGFTNQKELYDEIVLHYGPNNFASVLTVFSTFGEKVFLPEKLPYLVKFLEANPKNIESLNSKAGKLLIKVLFNNNITVIKKNQNLVSDFMYILNNMVDNGSSEAYLIRECVIIYKHK